MVTVPGASLEDRLERWAIALAPLAAGIIAFGIARSTMLPGLGFWDTGEFQTVAPVLGTAHPTGYPTYVLLGWLATLVLGPAGEPAFRMNLLSGVLLGVAAALVVVVVRQIGGRTLPALAAGIVLALTPIPWQVGSFADPHMLHLVMVAAILALLLGWESRVRAGVAGADRWLVGAAAVYGLSLGNHQLTILLAPGIALFVLATEPHILSRPRHVWRCAAALFGTAGLVYLELPIRAAMHAPLVYGHPDSLGGFLYVALGQQFLGDVSSPFGDLPAKGADLLVLAGRQLGVLAALVPAAFLAVAIRRPRAALLTGMWVFVTCWFASVYANASIDRYYLGPILCAVVWLGAGAAILVDAAMTLRRFLFGDEDDSAVEANDGATEVGGGGDAGVDAGPPVGSLLRDYFPLRVAFVAAALLVAPAIWSAPATFESADHRTDTGAGTWSQWVFATVPQDSVVVTWWSYSTPLWYRQRALGERPDIRIVDDRDRLDEDLGSVDDVIASNLARRPVFLVRLADDIAELEQRWQVEEVTADGMEPLYRVVGPAAAAPGG